MSHHDFQALIDPENHVSQLLLSHFLALNLMFRYVTIHRNVRGQSFIDPTPIHRTMSGWMSTIEMNLAPRFRKYNEWPEQFVTTRPTRMIKCVPRD